MNIYILTDLEGISGIYSKEQISPEERLFDDGRRYLTREINICADACKAEGVDKIYVRDGHGGGNNAIWDKLSDSVDVLISGITDDERYPNIDDCDGVILLGYHAMAGTSKAILEHTMSSRSVQNYYINGKKIGEVGLDAAILSEYGKPIIMVSGDDVLCAEAKELLPRVTAVEVKKAHSCGGGSLLSPLASAERIRQGVKAAIANPKNGNYDLISTEKPVRFRIEYTERTRLPIKTARPHMTFIDGRTVEAEADTVEEAFFHLF